MQTLASKLYTNVYQFILRKKYLFENGDVAMQTGMLWQFNIPLLNITGGEWTGALD